VYIEHIALWTKNLERMKAFYEKYFQATAGSKYQNTAKRFESYFLTFPTGSRIELMCRLDITETKRSPGEQLHGYIHIAIACGSEQGVNELTERIRLDGYQLVDNPRYTGDGYYESVVLDPDGNRLELTV
jgi:lactoylglutathione lyase